MSNLYQYLTENYKENEPFFLSDIQIEGMTGNNIRQQLKKLTDTIHFCHQETCKYKQILRTKSFFRENCTNR